MAETDLFIANYQTSLDDALNTNICEGKKIYCSFSRKKVDKAHFRKLEERKVASIEFGDGNIYKYPFSEILQ